MNSFADDRHHDRPRGQDEAPTTISRGEIVPWPRCQTIDDDEPMGGDPPCWAHLFEDEPPPTDR